MVAKVASLRLSKKLHQARMNKAMTYGRPITVTVEYHNLELLVSHRSTEPHTFVTRLIMHLIYQKGFSFFNKHSTNYNSFYLLTSYKISKAFIT